MKKALTITDLPVDQDRRDVAVTLDDIFSEGHGNEEDHLRFLAIIVMPRSADSSYITPGMLFQAFGRSYYILENLRSYAIGVINNLFHEYEQKTKSCPVAVGDPSVVKYNTIHFKNGTLFGNLVIVTTKYSLDDICTEVIAKIKDLK